MSESKPKAKRRLTDISFQHEGAHLALCSKSQGAANNYNSAIIMKARSPEFVQKMQQLKVTMAVPEFLQVFFRMYEDEAYMLAAIMGYQEGNDDGEAVDDDAGTFNPLESFWSWWKDKAEAEGFDPYMKEPTDADHQAYISAQLQGIEIIKSLKGEPDALLKFASLTEDDVLSVLQVQEKIEKGLSEKAQAVIKKAMQPKAKVKKTRAKVKKSEENMTEKTTAVIEKEVEVVEKSTLEALQKAFEDQKEILQKAQATIAAFEQEKKEALEKSRFAALKNAVKDEDKATVLFKSLKNIADEAEFEEVVKTLGEITKQADASDLFTETGGAGEGEVVQKESKVASILKAQYKQVK